DLYLLNRQDQYYTNGLLLSVHRAVDSLRLSQHEANRVWGIYGGQQIYTAYTGQISEIEEVDRPITAYLFLGADLSRYYTDESVLQLNVELGTIGRSALGRQAQESIHKAFNLYDISGWQYQLENAFGFDIGAKYARLLYRGGEWFDLTAQATGTLGLHHTNVAVSPVFRVGRINPLYATALFSGRLQSRRTNVANELFFYIRPQVSWIAYDATIQGGLLKQNKGPVVLEPNRWVLSKQVGVVYARHAFTFNLHYTFNTKESPHMFFRHQYGSLGLSYRY